MTKQKVLVIVGPTAVGKTALGIALAQQFNGEIISGDSMQVYRSLNIGTAKVTKQEMSGIPHYGIDILDVTQPFSASDFQKHAQRWIAQIGDVGKLPIIVGGTGLYIEGLLNHLSFGGENSIDLTIREQLNKRLSDQGSEVLWQELNQYDPDAASKISIYNPRRIVRALEVILSTGPKFSDQDKVDTQYDVFLIGLTMDRTQLYERINHRIDHMINQGLLDEVKWLYTIDPKQQYQATKAIGYKELFSYVNGQQSLENAIDYLKQQSRRYAKRQMTWFRNRMMPRWFDVQHDAIDQLKEEVEIWLKK